MSRRRKKTTSNDRNDFKEIVEMLFGKNGIIGIGRWQTALKPSQPCKDIRAILNFVAKAKGRFEFKLSKIGL